MSLLSNAVALANKVTGSLGMQVDVTWTPITTDGYGTRVPGTVATIKAIVDWKQRNVVTRSGETATSRATVTILDPTIIIGFNDLLVLPDGSTGPILAMSGPMDSSSPTPLLTEISIG